MSDELVVSGGGAVAVAPDRLLAAAADCRIAARQADGLAQRLASVGEGRSVAPRAPLGTDMNLLAQIRSTAARAADLATRLRTIAVAVDLGAGAYGLAERYARLQLELAAGRIAYAAAFAAPAMVALGIAALPNELVGAFLGWLALGSPTDIGGSFGAWLSDHRALLSDERFVMAVRALAGSIDDGARGLLHAPAFLEPVLDDRGLGLFGAEDAAAVVATVLAGEGLVSSRSIAVRGGATAPVAPPSTIAELVERIPPSVPEAPQVRIEEYDRDGGNGYVVYIGGTVDFGLDGGTEPWDMGSNVAAMAGVSSSAGAAVVAAMRAAGIRQDSEVTLVGHSQGGLLASRIAGSGDFAVRGIVTVGSPGARIEVPDETRVLAIEHREDLVPALAGLDRPESPTTVLVTRSLFDGAPVPAGESWVPAHELTAYQETAALVDASREERTAAAVSAILEPFGETSQPGARTEWRAVRGASGAP